MWKPLPQRILTLPPSAAGDPSDCPVQDPSLIRFLPRLLNNPGACSVTFDFASGLENQGQRIFPAVKQCEEGEEPRTFILEPDGEKATGYIPVQRRLNPNFILQPECVVQHQLVGHLSVFLEEGLTAFRQTTYRNLTISQLHDTLRGLNLCLQHLCREGVSHGNLKDGIFFSKGKVLLHGVSSGSNFIDRDMETFHSIVKDFASVMDTKTATVEEKRKRTSIQKYLQFLKDFRLKDQVKFAIGDPDYSVSRTDLNWPLLLLIHPTFWDDKRVTATRFVRNLGNMLRDAPATNLSLSCSNVFTTEVATKFNTWESNVRVSSNSVAKLVKRHMDSNSNVTTHLPVDIIAYCDNFIKHHADTSKKNCWPVRGMRNVIDELLGMFPDYLDVMYEAYLKAFASSCYKEVGPERVFFEEV